MFKRRLNEIGWRGWLLVGYILIVLVFSVLWTYLLLDPLADETYEQQGASLEAVAHSAQIVLEESEPANYNKAIQKITQDTNLRVTLVSSEGTVVADSQVNASDMENHLDRPEIQQALTGSIGLDQRASETTEQNQLYVAIPAKDIEDVAVIRAAEPSVNLNRAITSTRITGMSLLVIGIIISGLIAWNAFKNTAKPVSNLERIRTDFVANASHELKTPVTGIKLLSESIAIAAEDDELDTVQIFSKRLNDEATRLQTLVNELLDLSRLETIKEPGTVINATVDLHSAILTAVESRRPLAREKGLALEFNDHTPKGASRRVKMGSADASLIIENLIDNAIRYTEKGHVTVDLDIDDKRGKITVTDTGIGIPDRHLTRIFERFYRVDVARSREGGGTGLGLSLVRHAVLRSGGTIEVNSTVGEGTSFIVRIPLDE